LGYQVPYPLPGRLYHPHLWKPLETDSNWYSCTVQDIYCSVPGYLGAEKQNYKVVGSS